jgi:hypothetical protein
MLAESVGSLTYITKRLHLIGSIAGGSGIAPIVEGAGLVSRISIWAAWEAVAGTRDAPVANRLRNQLGDYHY